MLSSPIPLFHLLGVGGGVFFQALSALKTKRMLFAYFTLDLTDEHEKNYWFLPNNITLIDNAQRLFMQNSVSLLYHEFIANAIVLININAFCIVIDIYGYHFKISANVIAFDKLPVDIVNIYG